MSPFQRFMAELRRRHVPQTVAVYAVSAWAAIQFADVVVPNLGWPQWVVSATIIAAGVGFPVVIALAWLLEWGPEGVHRTAPAEEASPPAGERGKPIEPARSFGPWAVALGVLALGIAGALVVVGVRAAGDAASGTALEVESEEDAAEAARTRWERRQGLRDGAVPPVPPTMSAPDSALRIADSVLENLSANPLLRGMGLDSVIQAATRAGIEAGRAATAGPVEIEEPRRWRFGAPATVSPGGTLVVRGIARSEDGVIRVELDGREVARDDEGRIELPFEGGWVAGDAAPGEVREITVRVTVRGGESFTRSFPVISIPAGG